MFEDVDLIPGTGAADIFSLSAPTIAPRPHRIPRVSAPKILQFYAEKRSPTSTLVTDVAESRKSPVFGHARTPADFEERASRFSGWKRQKIEEVCTRTL
jgi:hypothetical protein